jgi:phosphohistidine phosphatase
MTIYLVRHAYAGSHGDPRYADDSVRPVTKKGRKQFERLVKKLVKFGIAPTVIGTSPYVRCTQTAELLVAHLAVSARTEVIDAFAPGCHAEDVITWANEELAEEVAYVGHAPDIELIAAELLGTERESVRFAKGAVAAIEVPDRLVSGGGTLRWLVTPKLFA